MSPPSHSDSHDTTSQPSTIRIQSEGDWSIRLAFAMTLFELSITVPRVAFLVALITSYAFATERLASVILILIHLN
jgi:hypothetical protein